MEDLRKEIAKGNFVRAAMLAAESDISSREVRQIRESALWQMAAINRNAPGTKKLAKQYWFSKEDVKIMLETMANQQKKHGNKKPFKNRYDPNTGRYLNFDEWKDLLLKNWER